MYKILIVLSFLIIPNQVFAQLLPEEGSMLHYRLIGFSFNPIPQAYKYIIEIAAGNYNTESSFKKNIILSHTDNKNKIIAEVPYFGKQYTWRTIVVDRDSNKTKSDLHHFSTTSIPDLDTNNTRLRITKNNGKFNSALVFLDGNRGLYDMKGRPVWYLPTIDGLNNESLRDVRDMKLSPVGTITFLLNNIPYEINYNGEILWKGPNDGKISGDSTEHYHHEFTRLNNGNYMVLSSEFALWKLPSPLDSNLIIDPKTTWDSISKAFYQKVEFGTIIEYDKNSNVVWYWRSSEYFKNSDLQNKINANNSFKDVHENSFYFDEKAKTIYIGFRNISRILKIHYPDGNVITSYGNKYKPGMTEMGNSLFCDQHACKLSRNGYLYLFNNNCCSKGNAPKIIMMEEPHSGKESLPTGRQAGQAGLKKIWEFVCPIESTISVKHFQFKSGGNVIELPDRSMFTSLSTDLYSNIFIVSVDKKILWSAFPEKWNQIETKWEPIYQYRASIITKQKEIGLLLWNGTIK